VLAENGNVWNEEAIAAVEAALWAGEEPRYLWKKHRYAHDDVRARLRAMFHGKCAYCESQMGHVSRDHVEHYRPKGAVTEDAGHPGYYWLGYSWDNLLLACARCNTPPGKGMQFPIRGQRARRPGDPLDAECALVLDPTGDDDPEEHIGFDVNVDGAIYPKRESHKGEATIRVCALDRPELHRRRQRHLELLQRFWHAYIFAARNESEEECRRWMDQIEKAIGDTAEWAALARAYFRSEGLLD
jgi:uncharacterized protein (TIGR02646 family)